MTDKQIDLEFGDWTESVEAFPESSGLDSVLAEIAQHIGKIMIEFNSLEDSVAFCVKKIMSSSEYKDQMVYVFLSEMSYGAKVGALVSLYGLMIQACGDEDRGDLTKRLEALETQLREACTRRNRYAHASWSEISAKRYVRVKTKAKKGGVFHSYRRFEVKDMLHDCDYIETAHKTLEEFDDFIWESVQK
jgi:hypothetical protein